MSTVPLIDISGLAGDLAARQAIARQIHDACRDIGFLCITGHGIDPDLIARVRAAALDFFDREVAEKEAILRAAPSFRGYVPVSSEALARSTGDKGAAVDLKEAFSMGPVDVPDTDYYHCAEAAAHFAPNRWPAAPADFRPALEAYYRAISDLADRLLAGFALALGAEEDWFRDKVDRHISNVRLLHYPAQDAPPAPGQLRAGAHTDYGCLTILLTEDAPGGLEVLNKAGNWEAVPHVPGSFVVNIGDLMAQWSNDLYVSTSHRVANPPGGTGRRRLSVAFFHQPNYDALIECLPNCSDASNLPRHAAVTSGEHRLLKVMRANS